MKQYHRAVRASRISDGLPWSEDFAFTRERRKLEEANEVTVMLNGNVLAKTANFLASSNFVATRKGRAHRERLSKRRGLQTCGHEEGKSVEKPSRGKRGKWPCQSLKRCSRGNLAGEENQRTIPRVSKFARSSSRSRGLSPFLPHVSLPLRASHCFLRPALSFALSIRACLRNTREREREGAANGEVARA